MSISIKSYFLSILPPDPIEDYFLNILPSAPIIRHKTKKHNENMEKLVSCPLIVQDKRKI